MNNRVLISAIYYHATESCIAYRSPALRELPTRLMDSGLFDILLTRSTWSRYRYCYGDGPPIVIGSSMVYTCVYSLHCVTPQVRVLKYSKH